MARAEFLRANNFARARRSSSSGVVPTMADPIDSIEGVCFLCCCLGPLFGLRVGIAWDFLPDVFCLLLPSMRSVDWKSWKPNDQKVDVRAIPFLCKKVKSFVHKAVFVISFDARKRFSEAKTSAFLKRPYLVSTMLILLLQIK